MKTKEHTRHVRDKVVEKFKAGLVYRNISSFEHLMDHCSVHYLKIERVWHNCKLTKTKLTCRRGVMIRVSVWCFSVLALPWGIHPLRQSPGFRTCTSPPVPHPQQSAGRHLRPVSSLVLRQFVSYPIVVTRPHKTSCLCVHGNYLPCSLLASSSHVKSPCNLPATLLSGRCSPFPVTRFSGQKYSLSSSACSPAQRLFWIPGWDQLIHSLTHSLTR